MADESSGRSLYQKVRLYVLIAIGVVLTVVIFQNTEDVETQVLFWTLKMPRAALLAATMLAGFAGGIVWSGMRRRK